MIQFDEQIFQINSNLGPAGLKDDADVSPQETGDSADVSSTCKIWFFLKAAWKSVRLQEDADTFNILKYQARVRFFFFSPRFQIGWDFSVLHGWPCRSLRGFFAKGDSHGLLKNQTLMDSVMEIPGIPGPFHWRFDEGFVEVFEMSSSILLQVLHIRHRNNT